MLKTECSKKAGQEWVPPLYPLDFLRNCSGLAIVGLSFAVHIMSQDIFPCCWCNFIFYLILRKFLCVICILSLIGSTQAKTWSYQDEICGRPWSHHLFTKNETCHDIYSISNQRCWEKCLLTFWIKEWAGKAGHRLPSDRRHTLRPGSHP